MKYQAGIKVRTESAAVECVMTLRKVWKSIYCIIKELADNMAFYCEVSWHDIKE